MWRRLILQFRTIRYLKFSQLFYYIRRRYLPPSWPSTAVTPDVRPSGSCEDPCATEGIYVDNSTFRFLNVEVDLGTGKEIADWLRADQHRLWQYNLHYFDYLRETARPNANKDELIDSWIRSNPQGSEPGWEPFTTSLRIVNWIFYLRQRPTDDLPKEWLRSLYLQVLWLERNDEKHILANHYFENLKALFFAGCFFAGDDALRWLTRTLKEIPDQVCEQTLGDGGHYERSHQYHCLMLENYLDICNLSLAYPGLYPSSFIEQVKAGAGAGLRWLSATLFPDGTIPLFNDSAFGIAIPSASLFAYAERLSFDIDQRDSKQFELINCPDTGLYGCRVRNDMFIIDCGEIGPPYQPGHTHCDFLSYELMLDNKRVVVDTGVCEYEPGAARNYVRSTRAHNTISIDGAEQSEIWGEFRVARRARKIGADISASERAMEFRGAYTGFHKVPGRIEHHRAATVALAASGDKFETITIRDQVNGHGRYVIENFVHFHPEIELQPSGTSHVRLLANGTVLASIALPPGTTHRIELAYHCPEFGQKMPNRVLILQLEATLPITLQYELNIRNQ